MTKSSFAPHKIQKLKALRDTVIVSDMTFESRQLSSGIIIPNDNGKSSGIRPRWGQIYAIGPDQHDVQIGQWICVAHGRWTRGIEIEDDQSVKTLRRIDPNDILLVSDVPPQDDTMSEAILVTEKSR